MTTEPIGYPINPSPKPEPTLPEYRGTRPVGEACGVTPSPEAMEIAREWGTETGETQLALAIDQHTERLREQVDAAHKATAEAYRLVQEHRVAFVEMSKQVEALKAARQAWAVCWTSEPDITHEERQAAIAADARCKSLGIELE
jgi:hypothetical protein